MGNKKTLVNLLNNISKKIKQPFRLAENIKKHESKRIIKNIIFLKIDKYKNILEQERKTFYRYHKTNKQFFPKDYNINYLHFDINNLWYICYFSFFISLLFISLTEDLIKKPLNDVLHRSYSNYNIRYSVGLIKTLHYYVTINKIKKNTKLNIMPSSVLNTRNNIKNNIYQQYSSGKYKDKIYNLSSFREACKCLSYNKLKLTSDSYLYTKTFLKNHISINSLKYSEMTEGSNFNINNNYYWLNIHCRLFFNNNQYNFMEIEKNLKKSNLLSIKNITSKDYSINISFYGLYNNTKHKKLSLKDNEDIYKNIINCLDHQMENIAKITEGVFDFETYLNLLIPKYSNLYYFYNNKTTNLMNFSNNINCAYYLKRIKKKENKFDISLSSDKIDYSNKNIDSIKYLNFYPPNTKKDWRIKLNSPFYHIYKQTSSIDPIYVKKHSSILYNNDQNSRYYQINLKDLSDYKDTLKNLKKSPNPSYNKHYKQPYLLKKLKVKLKSLKLDINNNFLPFTLNSPKLINKKYRIEQAYLNKYHATIINKSFANLKRTKNKNIFETSHNYKKNGKKKVNYNLSFDNNHSLIIISKFSQIYSPLKKFMALPLYYPKNILKIILITNIIHIKDSNLSHNILLDKYDQISKKFGIDTPNINIISNNITLFKSSTILNNFEVNTKLKNNSLLAVKLKNINVSQVFECDLHNIIYEMNNYKENKSINLDNFDVVLDKSMFTKLVIYLHKKYAQSVIMNFINGCELYPYNSLFESSKRTNAKKNTILYQNNNGKIISKLNNLKNSLTLNKYLTKIPFYFEFNNSYIEIESSMSYLKNLMGSDFNKYFLNIDANLRFPISTIEHYYKLLILNSTFSKRTNTSGFNKKNQKKQSLDNALGSYNLSYVTLDNLLHKKSNTCLSTDLEIHYVLFKDNILIQQLTIESIAKLYTINSLSSDGIHCNIYNDLSLLLVKYHAYSLIKLNKYYGYRKRLILVNNRTKIIHL